MPERPPILILMPDQMRADCMSCVGHPAAQTPNIDRIAAEGVWFEQATTVSPVCMSARASFISGRYPHSHGMWTNRGQLPADALTFFHVLRDAGYVTAHVGKSHYYTHGGRPGEKTHMREYEDYMHARGFDAVHETTGPWATTSMRSYMTDRWEELGLYEMFLDDYRMRWDGRREGTHPTTPSPLPVGEHPDSYVGRAATEFVRDYDGDRPLCLFVGFPGPHEPWDAPGEYATMYDPADPRDPIPRPETARAAGDRKDFEATPGLDAPTARRLRANYLGKISLMDHWVGEILAVYERRGWLDDLCVVFWSDHGEMAGDHGRLYKQTFHESSVRVPTLVRAPGRTGAGVTSSALAETVDIAPTVLDLAGLEPSRRFVGESLLPAGADPNCSLRGEQLSEIEYGGTLNFMLRSRDHKLAVDDAGEAFMLYDLSSDPDEQRNLAGDPAAGELEARLRERLFRRLLGSQDCM